jgi:hypothetical protein
MRLSRTAERLLIAVLFVTVIAIAIGLIMPKERPAARVSPAPISPSQALLQHMRAEKSPTLFWIDFLAFGNKSLAVGVRPAQPTIRAGVPLAVSGWAVDKDAKKLASAVYLRVDDGPPVATTYRMARPDVARYFHEAVYANAGFRGLIPTNDLSPGVHVLYLVVVNVAKTAYYDVDTKLRFVTR